MLNRNTHVALYKQLAEVIEADIVSGRYKSLDRLPTEEQLVATHAVSRITVRGALRLLLERGFIVRKQGMGTFVAKQIVRQELNLLHGMYDQLAAQGIEGELLKFGPMKASADIIARLASKGPQLLRRLRLYVIRGRPAGLVENHFADSVRGLSREVAGKHSTYELLERFARQPVARADFIIRARPAARAIANRLDIQAGSMLLGFERVSYSAADTPLELTRLWVNAETYEFSMRVQGRQTLDSRLSTTQDAKLGIQRANGAPQAPSRR